MTGHSNTANGYQALYSNTLGTGNTANGYQTLYSNTGSENTAIGSSALYSNTTGSGNIASGYQALYNNTTGNNNIANGYWALRGNTTGTYNAAIGVQALSGNTTGSYNIAVGPAVGNLITTGSSNILIGVGASVVAGGADAPTSSTSNYLNIGNTLEGDTTNASAVSAETLFLQSVASSVNYVKMSGGATGTGPTIASAGTDANVNLTLAPQGTGNTIISSGSVGVGTATPQATLDVNGYVKLALNTSQPVSCSSTNDGSIALTHTRNTCVCVGPSSAWVSTVTGVSCAW